MTILVFILFIFFVIMFIVYFDYIPSIVILSSYSSICSYSAHPKDPWVGGQHYVSMVLIHCLPTDTPYILGHVVDRRRDTPVESTTRNVFIIDDSVVTLTNFVTEQALSMTKFLASS